MPLNFSYTFNKLVDMTDMIWKYQRYGLIEEYYSRPALVAPFSFIPFIYSISCSFCCRKLGLTKSDDEDTDFGKLLISPKEINF